MVFACLLSNLVYTGAIFRAVFRDNDSQVAGREKKSLIPKQTRHSSKGHRATVAAKLGECLSFSYAVGVPCHDFCTFLSFFHTLKGQTAHQVVVVTLMPAMLGNYSFIVFAFSGLAVNVRITDVHPNRVDTMLLCGRLAILFL
jgi:hypothetical protein